MPHPSYPVDDFRAHSLYREHAFCFGRSSRTLGSSSLDASGYPRRLACELRVCLMDYFDVSILLL
ncbi:hypothetical protein DENSPDRAFT_837808 [Dentipellis sp. KUC8613]|nr:hypothetical protein DENSPDRAFT_837808 [Dentipellis sp. KUC8613]